jgi:outer membrane protein assembly factor BamE (lipoprotein component of BamABCDE complex)
VLSRSPILVDFGALVTEISSGIDGHALGDVMRRSDIAVAMILTSLVLTGCTSVGNDSIADATNETVSQHLVKGKTTQADVRKAFGDPIKTSFASNGNESWEYEFSRMQSKVTNFIPYVNLVHSGAEGDKKSLVVFFDKAKIVQDFTMSTSRIEVNHGLITR